MQVFINTLTGITLKVENSDTNDNVKATFKDKEVWEYTRPSGTCSSMSISAVLVPEMPQKRRVYFARYTMQNSCFWRVSLTSCSGLQRVLKFILDSKEHLNRL